MAPTLTAWGCTWLPRKKQGIHQDFDCWSGIFQGLCLVFLSAEIRARRWKEEAASCAPGAQPDQEPGCRLWQPLNKISNGRLQLYNLALLEVCLLSAVQCCRESPEAPWNKPVQKQGSHLDPVLCISFSSQLISYFNSAHYPWYMGSTQFKDRLVISSF